MISVNAVCSAASTLADVSMPMIVNTGSLIPAQHASVASADRNLLGLMARRLLGSV